jgi:radical SAM superfamily enzyme YgiQ (UPF0313 family)
LKIALANPPIEDFYITGIRRQPLGLLYIAASLINEGHDVSLINCHSRKKSVMEIPSEFAYLKKYIDHEDNLLRFPFSNYSHFGMSWQEIERQIGSVKADLWLVSSLFTTYYQETDRVIDLIRMRHGNVFIAAGGYHASMYPEYIIEKSGADFVIAGEGEISSLHLAEALESGMNFEKVPGLIYKGETGIIKNERLMAANPDDLPIPARELLRDSDFKMYRKRGVSLIASRGCPNNCSFCTGRVIWGRGYRGHSVERIISEIELSADAHNAGIINFEDDNLFPSKKRGIDILSAIIDWKKKSGREYEFTAMNGVSLENLDEEIIELMKLAGFNELNISLVSHSSQVQRAEKRPFDSARFKEIALFGKKAGMNVRGYFIIGLPGQDRGEIYDTIDFMETLDVKVFPSVYYNVFSPENEWKMQRSSAFFNESSALCRDDILMAFNRCFVDNKRNTQ